MKFVDLFAGLGGFHIALKRLGHECVFACEVNRTLSELYKKNFNIESYGDIKKIDEKSIPSHDILCAGFPCQPFSKAGKRQGNNDIERGNFLSDIRRIVIEHHPSYLLLENVPHLKKVDNEKTWNEIKRIFKEELGYSLKEEIFSPHQFGIPQFRYRLYIIGSRVKNLDFFKITPRNSVSTDINMILDKRPKDAKRLSRNQNECLSLWQKIIDIVPPNEMLPQFPIWTTEFGATYPFDEVTPYYSSINVLSRRLGSFGDTLKGYTKEEQLLRIPKYARNDEKKFPNWKIRYIRQNREFFNRNKNKLEPFIEELKKRPFSWQKFEWNCGDSERIIKKYIIQFRASGIRVKKTNYSPSLVCTNTQIPIIGWEGRYISRNEALRLQSLSDLKYLPEQDNLCFSALGNAVNALIIKIIAKNLFKY